MKKKVLEFKEYLVFDGKMTLVEKFDATKFESDLVNAFNTKAGGESTGGYQSKEAERAAKACVENMIPVTGKPKKAYKLSGGAAKKQGNVLTPVYLSGGEGKSVKSQEPKTDVVFVGGKGKFNCSVKANTAAQIASAQTNEIYAVLNAAFGGKKGEKMARDIATIIERLGNPAAYEKTRKMFKKKFGSDNYDAMITKIMGLKPDSGKPTKEEMEDMNAFLDMMGVSQNITATMVNFMSDPANRMTILEEFALGKKRFTNKEYSPTHFLTWDPSGEVSLLPAREFLKKKFDCFKMGLRSRGRTSMKADGTRGSRGQALRIDIGGTCSESYMQMQAVILEGTVSESQRIENYNCIYETIMSSVGDWAKRTADTMKKTGMAVYAKAKEWFSQFMEIVKRIASFVAKLASYGFGVLTSFFGVTVDSMEFHW